MKKIILPLLFLMTQVAVSQETDTLKVVSYNLLNFPSTAPERIDTLKNIMTYLKPDILLVCELNSSAGANDILFNALNEDGVSDYDMADYVPGPDTENMLYFNSAKLGLLEQNVIPTVLRDINEYVLYYKSIDLATTTDTTFFYVYVCHLKASSGNEEQRNLEAVALKTYMASRNRAENILIGGDFNFYGSDTEPAWNTILNGGSVVIKDPITLPGHWHADAGYAYVHTQSTRTESFNGGSAGGLDDRFDFIFVGEDLKNFSNDALYVNGSYRAVGQDGLHYNQSLIDGTNLSEPAPIISSLYYMSDHLPIYLEIAVVKEAADVNEISPITLDAFYDAQLDVIQFTSDLSVFMEQNGAQFLIYSVSGQLVSQSNAIESGQGISTKSLPAGTYILTLNSVESFSFKFVKP